MTIIVYDSTAKIMGCDSRAYSGDRSPIGSKNKIFVTPNGDLLGVSSSNTGMSKKVLDWVLCGCNFRAKDENSFTALLVNKKNEVFFFDENYLLSGPLQGKYFAIGTGKDFALGALEANILKFAFIDIAEAIEIACKLDVWSSLPVMLTKLPPTEVHDE